MFNAKNKYYKVADLVFKVSVPSDVNLDKILPSFKDFICDEDELYNNTIIFEFDCTGNIAVEEQADKNLIDSFCNDVGNVRLYKNDAEYIIELKYHEDSLRHYMKFDDTFHCFEVIIDWNDKYISNIVDSMVRIAFSQSCLLHDAVSIHASVVVLNNYGYLFLGKSGTGKSTHSRLWIDNFRGAELLNDDNPIIRLKSEKFLVYGSPWSGKTHCYKNESYPIGGFVRLEQSKNNAFKLLKNVNAFSSIMPSCSAMRNNRKIEEHLFYVIIQIEKKLRVGHLDCLPNSVAAKLCYQNIAVSV